MGVVIHERIRKFYSCFTSTPVFTIKLVRENKSEGVSTIPSSVQCSQPSRAPTGPGGPTAKSPGRDGTTKYVPSPSVKWNDGRYKQRRQDGQSEAILCLGCLKTVGLLLELELTVGDGRECEWRQVTTGDGGNCGRRRVTTGDHRDGNVRRVATGDGR